MREVMAADMQRFVHLINGADSGWEQSIMVSWLADCTRRLPKWVKGNSIR